MKFRPKRWIKDGLEKMTRPLLVNAFHRLYYDNAATTWQQNTFLGYPVWQCPFDLQLYQEVIFRTHPRYILQTGVQLGGSMIFFASIFDLMKDPDAVVVGIDIQLTPEAKKITHPRVKLIEGSSVDPKVVERVRSILPVGGGMVSLDSDHTQRHVAAELKVYSEFVGTGQYLAVRVSFEGEKRGVTREQLILDTGINLEPHEVIEAYAKRWHIEPMFHQAKDNWGWNETWQQSRQVVHSWLHILGIGYALPQLLAIKGGDAGEHHPVGEGSGDCRPGAIRAGPDFRPLPDSVPVEPEVPKIRAAERAGNACIDAKAVKSRVDAIRKNDYAS